MDRAGSPREDDSLLLMTEVSALTRLTVDGLRYLRARGEGPPSFRLGRKVVYRQSEVREWIAQQARDDTCAVRAGTAR